MVQLTFLSQTENITANQKTSKHKIRGIFQDCKSSCPKSTTFFSTVIHKTIYINILLKWSLFVFISDPTIFFFIYLLSQYWDFIMQPISSTWCSIIFCVCTSLPLFQMEVFSMEVDLEGVARIHRGLPLHLHVVQGGFVGGAEGEHGSPHILVQGEVNRYITSAKPYRPERATHYGVGEKHIIKVT